MKDRMRCRGNRCRRSRGGEGNWMAHMIPGDPPSPHREGGAAERDLYDAFRKGRLHESLVAAEAETRVAKRGLWGMEAVDP